MDLSLFHPLIARWFVGRFGEPTAPQVQGWAHIAEGRDTLVAISALAEQAGTPLPEIRAMVRSGDTPARERNLMVRRPPHILITTPESLYILLTAQRSRAFLRTARAVIVDEIHAVAGDKRGSHLALSLER